MSEKDAAPFEEEPEVNEDDAKELAKERKQKAILHPEEPNPVIDPYEKKPTV